MNQTVIFPSPNWFQVAGLTISEDGWLIYGGPSKSLCVVEPLNLENDGKSKENYRYRTHVVNNAHFEKIVSVDISREWPEKKIFLTGSDDGTVKQWIIEHVQNTIKIKSTHRLELHKNENEMVAGVGYSSESYAITVGTFENIVKWDLKSNVAKSYNKFLKGFRPSCVACSHHLPLHVAIGTKQGVVLVINLDGLGNIVYKIRGQDDEITNVSWCPQYEVILKKSLKELVKKKSNATERLAAIRSEADDESSFVHKNSSAITKTSTDDIDELVRKSHAAERLAAVRSEVADESSSVHGDSSDITKKLPDDSCDESIVEEDKTFDIYKDHEADEFGHKKFEPIDIVVKIKEEKQPDDFLAECLKLKEDILKIKNDSEPSIANLVEALDKTHVDSDSADKSNGSSSGKKEAQPDFINDGSVHVQKHLLATIGKVGVRIWSKSGKLVAGCVIPSKYNKKNKTPIKVTTLLWHKPDVLVLADGKNQLLQCNPLAIDCKNKLQWKVIHTLHKRGLFCIASGAPRVQLAAHSIDSPDHEVVGKSTKQWPIWSVAQDRDLICYSLEERKVIATYNTCGGYLYTVQSCPYDASRIAISVGDGAVRVLQVDTLEDDDTKLGLPRATSYWQNVQGKVLTVAWHPTHENLIAFSTAEARIGLIDVGGKMERPAKTLVPALRSGIYSLSWGQRYDLYAVGGGKFVVYQANKPEERPVPIPVEFEGQSWELTSATWTPRGILVGNNTGAVAILDAYTWTLVTAIFIFRRMIHCMAWHPQQTSLSSEVSPYKDLIAVCALCRSCEVAILEYADKGDGPKLYKWKALKGHRHAVHQVVWNPHKDGLVLSTSQDNTVRVWDISKEEGECVAVFDVHSQSSLGAAWSAFPQLASTVISGGGDSCLRIWRVEDHPASEYPVIRTEVMSRREKKKMTKVKVEEDILKAEEHTEGEKENENTPGLAANVELKPKVKPKQFMLPIIHKQMGRCDVRSVRKMIEKYFPSLLKSEDGEKKSVITKVEENGLETDTESDTEGKPKNKKVEPNETDPEEIEKSHEPTNEKVEANDDLDDEETETERSDEAGNSDSTHIDFVNIFGSTNEFNKVLDLEMNKHLKRNQIESYIILSIFRGHIDSMVQLASARDALCPFIVSITPCVSFKYWKEVSQLYLAQMERLVAKDEEYKVDECKLYGGSIYRRVALMLSVHDVRGAVGALLDAVLFKEAYVLAKARHMDSIAVEALLAWSHYCIHSGRKEMAAICHLAAGDAYTAAEILSRSNKQQLLGLASEMAVALGRPTFATHIEEKKSLIASETPDAAIIEDLKPLPSKIDAMKHEIEIPVDESDSDID